MADVIGWAVRAVCAFSRSLFSPRVVGSTQEARWARVRGRERCEEDKAVNVSGGVVALRWLTTPPSRFVHQTAMTWGSHNLHQLRGSDGRRSSLCTSTIFSGGIVKTAAPEPCKGGE